MFKERKSISFMIEMIRNIYLYDVFSTAIQDNWLKS